MIHELFKALREFDEFWSKAVQDGNLPFDAMMARRIHANYKWWLETFGSKVNPEHSDIIAVKIILHGDFEELLKGMEQAYEGKYDIFPLTKEI